MKKLIYLLSLLVIQAKGQQPMPEISLPVKGDLHFISPEPIQYVDISSNAIEGNIALPNVLRIRFKRDTSSTDATVTIAGEKFFAQYHVRPVSSASSAAVEIQPGDTRPLDISGIDFSRPQLKKLAYMVFTNADHQNIATARAFGIIARLNHLYTAGDYILLDISYRNKTNLKYNIEAFRFKIDDKQVTKASNVQSIEIKPEMTLFEVPSFSKHYRNIFVLKKLSFPGNKVLNIELSEKQISGRVITLPVSYQNVLEADTINF